MNSQVASNETPAPTPGSGTKFPCASHNGKPRRRLRGVAFVAALVAAVATTPLWAASQVRILPSPSLARLVVIVARSTGLSTDVVTRGKTYKLSRLIVGTLHGTDPAPVPTDIQGKCNGEIPCQECTDACITFKYGQGFVEVLEAINEDGSQDETINRIQDYTFGLLNDFGCTCTGF